MQIRLRYIIPTFVLLTSCVFFRLKPFKQSLTKTNSDTKDYSTKVKFRLKTWMFVKTKIQGQNSERELVFDTGSPFAYTFNTKNEFGLATKKLFAKTEYGIGTVELGGIKMNNLAYLVSNHEEFGNSAGIFGVNAMQHSIWEINFSDSSIKFSNDLQNFNNIADSYSTKFKPLGAQETPILKFAIGKDTVEAFLDTGFPGSIQLNRDFKADTHSVSIKSSYRNISALGYQSKKDYFVYTKFLKARSLNIAGLNISPLILTQMDQYKGRNLIGIKFLQNFIVTIDWPNRTIYFKPNKETSFPKTMFTYGFYCYTIDGTLKVTEVFKNSSAEKLGLKSGDIITSINGQLASDIDKSIIYQINSDLSTDKEIKLLVKNKSEMILKKADIFN